MSERESRQGTTEAKDVHTHTCTNVHTEPTQKAHRTGHTAMRTSTRALSAPPAAPMSAATARGRRRVPPAQPWAAAPLGCLSRCTGPQAQSVTDSSLCVCLVVCSGHQGKSSHERPARARVVCVVCVCCASRVLCVRVRRVCWRERLACSYALRNARSPLRAWCVCRYSPSPVPSETPLCAAPLQGAARACLLCRAN